MEASFDDWLQPFEDSMANHDNWLITDQEEEGAAATRKNGGGMMSASALVHAFGGGGGDIKLEDRFDEDEEIATGNQGDLERFFKHGSTGLDTLLTNVEVKEELSDVNAFSFRWDDDEELKLNGSDTEDRTPSLLLDPEDQLLLNSGLLSFDDITLHSTSTSLSSTSPSLSLSSFASVSLSSSLPSPMLSDSKGSSPSSPAPSSSPLPSSPSSILPVAPAPSFQLQQQPPQMQQQHAMNYAHCGSMPQYAGFHAGNAPSGRAASAVCAPPPPVAAMPAVAPTSTPRAPRPRRDSISGSKASAAAKKAGVGSTPPRPRRRRAASTTVARDKQERMEKEMAGDDKAKAILSGPLTLEKLASLSTLKVSVLQKQLKMLNASTKGSKAQLIQRLVRYMYLFSQQHRHQLHSQCPSTCGVQHSASASAANAGSRCNGLFVDPTLINADSLRAKAALERGRSSSIGDGTSILSSSAPSLSVASYLSTHVFPTPLQITLTGRIVEEEEEEEFSD